MQPTWSLCAEEFLYIVILLMVCFIPQRHLLKAMATAAIISVVLRIYTVISGGNLVGAYLLPPWRMDGFMLGAIIAVVYSKDQLAWVNTRVLNWLVALLAAVFVAMTYSNVNLYGRFAITVGYAFYAVFFSAIVIRVIKGRFRFLEKGPLAYVGTISYFVYLFHFPIVYGMSHLNVHSVVLNLVLTLGAVIGAATVSWYTLEKPLIDRGKALNAASTLSDVLPVAAGVRQ